MNNESIKYKHSPTMERLLSQNTTPVPATASLIEKQMEKRAFYSPSTTPVPATAILVDQQIEKSALYSSITTAVPITFFMTIDKIDNHALYSIKKIEENDSSDLVINNSYA